MRIRTCRLLGLGRVISELSSALALTAGMDWAEERTGVMRKSSETLSSFIAKSFHGVSCFSFFVRYVMSIGSRKDARMIVLASLPWDFAQVGSSKSPNLNCR